jgi:hypothetical protein
LDVNSKAVLAEETVSAHLSLSSAGRTVVLSSPVFCLLDFFSPFLRDAGRTDGEERELTPEEELGCSYPGN